MEPSATLDLTLDPLDRLNAGKREFGEFGGVNASVEISTTFTVLDANTLEAIFAGAPDKGGCYVYGRAFNPTVRHLGRLLAALEGCEAGYPCSSGMAAISCTLLSLCNAGDHIIASNTIYGGTHALLKTFLPQKANIATTFVDITDLAAVKAAVRAAPPGRVKVIYTEAVSNPTLRVADLAALAAIAHGPLCGGGTGTAGGGGGASTGGGTGGGAALVVDNTFTPFIITPRKWGADVVVHSLTKFVSGASDIIGGAVCGSAAFVRGLMDFHAGPCMLLGPTMDPRVASELALRLPHLALRMQEHSRRAAAFAERLHALGAPVTYPGHPAHPQHGLLAAQANPGYGAGGLLGLDLGCPARANAFMERLQNKHGFGFMAVSLGYFDTLMSLSAASTSSELSDGDMAASGIGRGYVRMSVGITGSLEERWRQLEEAYSFVRALGPAATAPFRAVKLRRRPSGGVEQLISWPSLGSFGAAGGGDVVAAGGGGTAAAARAAATAAAAVAAAVTAAAAPRGGGGGVVSAAAFNAALEEALAEAAGRAAEVAEEVAAAGVVAVRDEDDEDEGEVSSAVVGDDTSGGTVASKEGGGAAGGGGGGAIAVTVVQQQLATKRPAASAFGAPAAQALIAAVAVPSVSISDGGSAGAAEPPSAAVTPSPSPSAVAAAAVAAAAAAAKGCPSPAATRPVKIRRAGSTEIHYIPLYG
ncbi:hypothetical protein HXX76_000808 [Chlamydomonas incerta]|uniref:Methionine gamma-lyase n=1 Tax=Chlamydomonas incerta TaxID=51695 RepID=A0A835WF23_CHLIN|nr:hypothetical protein HXX76_000808 [Chlamydomonas incerta]|eukprot:KAG2446216.1 hypothetical protein HXX76_000808 [Chlamydomonas incerta]